MAIAPRLEIRQSTALVMTPQLRQAIKLLQLSNLELGAFVAEELQRNPLLERDEGESAGVSDLPAPDQRGDPLPVGADSAALIGSDMLPLPEASPLDAEHADTFDASDASERISRQGGSFDGDERGIEQVAEGPRSLREHLSLQLRLAFDQPAERLIGAHLIALLDPAGRLAAEPAALAAALGTSTEAVENVRQRMLQFDPVGCFACDLKECLAAQLAERNRLDPAMAALLDHLDLLGRRDLRQLMTVCGVDAEDLADMIGELRQLDPKPGTRFDSIPLSALVPDILMRPDVDGGFRLELNQDTLPRILVNHALYTRISMGVHGTDRSFLAEQMAAANWLVRSLAQRADTILKVATEIVRRQNGFFFHGITHLRPLTLREVADAVEMHESTVSRVTSNKYIATPRGILELKYFFTTALGGIGGETHSAEAVRSRIRTLVREEAPQAVLSDDAIAAVLRREGVDIARRTVAKYREALHIPGSVQRRREKALSA